MRSPKQLLADGGKNLAIALGLLAACFIVVGGLELVRHGACSRLDAERIAFLEPGHVDPGEGYRYVKGMGTDNSELLPYLEAVAALEDAGCDV